VPAWTTSHLPERDQFSYWREVLCEAFITLRPEREGEGPCPSSVTGQPLSALNVTTVTSKRQQVFRGPAEIRKMPLEFYFLNLQLAGQCRIVTDDREVMVEPGAFSLVDTTRPYLLDCCSEDWSINSFRIPRHMLGPLLQHPEQSVAARVARDTPLGTIMIDFLNAVAAQAHALSPHAASAISGELVNLLALTLGGARDTPGASTSLRHGLRESIARHIEAHVADPHLSAASVAAHFGISVRYLHKVFEEHERSFGQTVIDCRLERCARDLAAHGHQRIADIAFRWGFNDISHFNRRFRARFALSPRDYRQRSREANG